VIRTPEAYQTAMAEIARLVALDPKADTPEADRLELLAGRAEAWERAQYPGLDLGGQLDAWEALMLWRCARPLPAGILYREISPNCNPDDPEPALIAEWGTAPRGTDDGAMAVGARGQTYGEAAFKLAGMLGIL
jgi:hypothetical protein